MIPKFENPRWPNGPRICIRANLPAFNTPKDLATFMSNNAPRASFTPKQCAFCELWHVGKERKKK